MSTTATPRPQSNRPRAQYTKGEKTKDRVIEAAFELFARSGYLGVSLRDIASAADLTHAGLLHHFPGGKDELLEKVLAKRDAADAVVLFDRTKTADQHLADIGRIVERNMHSPGLVALYVKLSSEATDPEHPAHSYFANRYERLREWLTALLVELLPEERVGDSADIAIQLIALMDGLQTQWLIAPRELDMHAQVLSFARLVGLSSRTETPAEEGSR